MTLSFKPKKNRRLLYWKIALLVFLVVSLVGTAYFYYLYTEITSRFSSRRWSVPSRVFSATVPLYPGQHLSQPLLREMLEERRYQESSREPLSPGEFSDSKNCIIAHLRDFRFPGHVIASQRVRFEFQKDRLTRIQGPSGEIPFLELEPIEIARLYGPERESRLLINIHAVPPYLINAVVSIEDHRFFEHRGVDWQGILRAFWTDVRARRVLQGGSTITQQLIKNYFLEPSRTLKRKIVEVSMALILESLYSKAEILEMYLNEIYMGQRGSVAIHGIGEASLYYFGRNVEDLTLAEAALLAGMIRAPNSYSPLSNMELALDRRNVVLTRMLNLNKISAEAHRKAIDQPIRIPRRFLPVNSAPYFVDYVRQQLHELYAPEVLESQGLSVCTTLHPEMAFAAEVAVREGLEELERSSGRGSDEEENEPLQAALIAVQPRTGAVLALVGGRDYSDSSFSRAIYAYRQPGSAIKPFVYLSALEDHSLTAMIPDEARSYRVEEGPWTPVNFDRRYRGMVTLRTALEESLNAATVNLAMEIGLERVIQTLQQVGIQSPMKPLPSLPLGAFEVSPLELAGAYAALGNDGQKPYLLSLREVVSETGAVQERRNVEMVSVTSPAKAYLVTSMLEGVVERGTARNLRQWGIDFKYAGKTGTSSDYRDSWFIGYTTDLLALVWVGYDSNRPTNLTGAKGAGLIWANFLKRVRPWIHPQPFRIPPGVAQRIVCLDSGGLSDLLCPNKQLESFLVELAPTEYCTLHGRR